MKRNCIKNETVLQKCIFYLQVANTIRLTGILCKQINFKETRWYFGNNVYVK